MSDDLTPDNDLILLRGTKDAETAWILVTDKQAEAASACEPDDAAVYRLRLPVLVESRTPEGLAAAVADKKTLIFCAGDPAQEHTVFEDAAAFGRACEDAAAREVRFVWLGPSLDKYLGNGTIEQRKERLARVLARTGKKPAKAKPKPPTAAEQRAASMESLEREAREEGRPVIDVNADRLEVIDKLVAALKDGPDKDRIYNLGGKLAVTEVDENGATVAELVDDERLLGLLSRSTRMISVTTKGVNAAWPETKTLTALYGRHRDFRSLRGIAPSPIVRDDNTIAAEDGYDEASQVLLDLAGFKPQIPANPSPKEIEDALHLLLDEWLGDFPLATGADRTNLLALILTYPLRDLVSLVPLAVISAKSQGTGKSKLVGLIVYLFTRTMPIWDSLPGDENETRKQITTLLATASPFLVFDESPKIGGKAINRLLTASTWSDRLLGVNKRAALPNRSVLVADGNNVEVLGDTRRRYYPIELFYDGEDPENRPESDFQHPDIEAWTDAHRDELLTAVFTLIRAWQVADRPKRATSFGSFERWEAVIGGVIENAGLDGFLDNLSEHRESVDYEEGLWNAHTEWLARTFPGGEFTVRKVVERMVRTPGAMRYVDPSAELPPDINGAPTDADYPAKLGKLYHQRHGRWSGGYRISKAERRAGGNQTKWLIETSPRLLQELAEARAAAGGSGSAGTKETSASPAIRKEREAIAADLPHHEAKLAALQARDREQESPEAKLLRLQIEIVKLRNVAEKES